MPSLADRLAGGLVTADETLEQEFERSIAESSTLAFRVAYSVLRHRQDAEDVAQEAFVRAHKNFRRLRDRARFRTWLVRITWRLALDHRRAARRREVRESVADEPSAPPTPVDRAVERQRAERLWQAIDGLSAKLRVVVVLTGIEEHDVAEVARLLDLPEGTVRSRLFLARRRLKELLK